MSFIDVGAVHQHLQVLGHTSISIDETKSILRNLGFNVAKQHTFASNIEKVEQTTATFQTGEQLLDNKHPKNAATKTISGTKINANKSKKHDQFSSLATRLDTIENQLYKLSLLQHQDSVSNPCEPQSTPSLPTTDTTARSPLTDCCILGDAVKQLQDYARGIWPEIANPYLLKQNGGGSHDTSTNTNAPLAHGQRSDDENKNPVPRQSRYHNKKSDPVKRYQYVNVKTSLKTPKIASRLYII